MTVASYNLLELIGRGGMGEVYRCVHQQSSEVFAIKILSAESIANPVMLKRFERECGLVMRLRHPHIVAGVEYGIDKGRPFLVMEYMEGHNLAALVREQGPLPEGQVLRLAREIGSALALAHEEKLIHRDVKPENVLLNAGGSFKLADLGLAKDLADHQGITRPGSHLGTISYMAPEQFGDADKVDHRCDIYGLGATLYFALTGTCPFPDKGAMTTLAKKLRNEFQAARVLVPTVSENLNAGLCLALDAKLELRPHSMRQFVEMLQNSEEDRPVEEVNVLPMVPDPEQERRRAKRFPTHLDAECAPLQSGKTTWTATVCDVSLTGVLLESARRFEPSSVLRVQLVGGPNDEEGTFLVRVCWARKCEGRWALGCSFGKALTESELDVFLKNKSTTRFS